ncbi:MAG TPA: sigma-70 family RNA polymerase sigma factor [Puia sp.]|jgi:RNA polymerase sigma-70 factor (ECF subfamily)
MKTKLFSSPANPVVADPAHWVAQYADYLYSYALSRLEDDHLCRDLVQETFLAALEKLKDFKGESSERTWLTAILKYKVIDVYRKQNSTEWLALGPHDAEPDFFESDNGHWKEAWEPQPMAIDQQDPATQNELARILQHCLERLPALWFSIFSMKHLDELKAEAICKQLKLTPSNYWVILHRAKVNLRACIQKEWV